MKQRAVFFLILFYLTGFSYACCGIDNTWYVSGEFGLAAYKDIDQDNGKTNAAGRLSIGHVLVTQDYFQLGLEAGVQSGNSMRLTLPEESLDSLGGLPIEAELKPMLDLLLELRTETLESWPLFGFLKGGASYQQLHLNRDSISSIKKIAPELIVGLGYKINEHASIQLGYQYLWGKTPELLVDPLTETGILHNIPARRAILLGFTFNFL